MTREFNNARELVKRVLDTRFFHPEGEEPAAIPFHFEEGEDPLVVIVGPNAGGKSFFRRVTRAVCGDKKDKDGVECIHVSMEGRQSTGFAPWLTFVYGDESYESTGVNSIHTVLGGIRTARSRETPHVIIWDEPDIGMSEGSAASVGRAIADFSSPPPPHTLASLVITHRKALVAELAPRRPHYLHLGLEDAPQTLDDWLLAPPQVKPLEDIEKDSRERFKRIQRILNDSKEKKGKGR